MKVALIACCGAKLSGPAPAHQLYQSALFKKSRQYAETFCDEFAILSAKHGLVLADQLIDPYDVTLTEMTAAGRREWAGLVMAQLMDRWPLYREPVHFVFLAGANYRDNLMWMLFAAKETISTASVPVEVSVPMQGMAIGHQLQWLGQQIKLCPSPRSLLA